MAHQYIGCCTLTLILTCCTPLLATQRPTSQPRDPQHADVIVYGATPGGVCAAIAAAREGASVILLEPTPHIGGLSTGGLSHCDSNQMVRSTLRGLFEEWHLRIVSDYTDRGLPVPYDPTKKDQSRWTFEPHVALRVTLAMLKEAGVSTHTEQQLVAVQKEGPHLAHIQTTKHTFSAKVFIDGTYEGDLMAAAGVDWTIGRESRSDFGESYAGKQYPKQPMAFSGVDSEGQLLPLVTTSSRGELEAGDQNIMTYSFRLCLTEDPDNLVPIPKPDNYDPAEFEVVRRALRAGINSVGFDLYPLPGNKLDGNNSIGRQFSIGLVGGGKQWHSATPAQREQIWQRHKQYTLAFYHFLTTDPVVPVAIRERYAKLGLCKDEFAQYDHFPPALYVRESRRMRGMYVLSQKDILDEPQKPDPIAISSFPIDSHDCQRIAVDGQVINEGTIFPVRRIPGQGYAYHVPYRSILPKPGQCDNLLVPVALSCTHVGICSLRIEGTWMAIGQGAGVAAALAAGGDVPVQKVPYDSLRKRLLDQNQVLALPEPTPAQPADSASSLPADSFQGTVLDDSRADLRGQWSRSTNFKPYVGQGYVFCGRAEQSSKGTGLNQATFRFQPRQSGTYKIAIAYSPHPTRAKHVPLSIQSGDQQTQWIVDQTKPMPAGKIFREIGTVELSDQIEAQITISDRDASGFVTLDAIQLVRQNDAPISDRDK